MEPVSACKLTVGKLGKGQPISHVHLLVQSMVAIMLRKRVCTAKLTDSTVWLVPKASTAPATCLIGLRCSTDHRPVVYDSMCVSIIQFMYGQAGSRHTCRRAPVWEHAVGPAPAGLP